MISEREKILKKLFAACLNNELKTSRSLGSSRSRLVASCCQLTMLFNDVYRLCASNQRFFRYYATSATFASLRLRPPLYSIFFPILVLFLHANKHVYTYESVQNPRHAPIESDNLRPPFFQRSQRCRCGQDCKLYAARVSSWQGGKKTTRLVKYLTAAEEESRS